MRAPGRLCCQVLTDAPFAKLAEPCPSALPLLPHHRPQSAAYPRFKVVQHRRRLTVAEVSEPSSQISRDLLDHLLQADAAGSPGLLPNPLLEASDGLGGDPPPRFSFAREAESKKLPLPRSGYGALRLIYLELETMHDEARNALHHSLSRSFAAHVDVAIVGITHEAVTTPL